MTKTKNVQDFSPAATRIYLAAKKGVALRTNASHVKRIIDKELDKHSLSKREIKKEISNATVRGIEVELEKAEKLFDDQIKKLVEGQKVALTKEQEKINILESEKKSLIDEAKYLVEDKEVLIAQLTDLKNKKSDKEAEKENIPPNGPVEDTPPNSDQEEKPVEDAPTAMDQGKKATEDIPDPSKKEKPAEGKKK